MTHGYWFEQLCLDAADGVVIEGTEERTEEALTQLMGTSPLTGHLIYPTILLHIELKSNRIKLCFGSVSLVSKGILPLI